jgi:hypothetical protein
LKEDYAILVIAQCFGTNITKQEMLPRRYREKQRNNETFGAVSGLMLDPSNSALM